MSFYRKFSGVEALKTKLQVSERASGNGYSLPHPLLN
jgi:hypothetical protein